MVRKTREGSFGGVIDYRIHDVAGDGNCYYRAVYNLLQESPAGQEVLNIVGDNEDAAIHNIRDTLGKILRTEGIPDALATIDNLCDMAQATADLDLSEMYPFVTDEVCEVTGKRRYRRVARMIEEMASEDPMFASGLEIHMIQTLLSATTPLPAPDLSLLVISVEGRAASSKSRKPSVATTNKWKNDLLALLRNTTTRRVAVLLNVNNLHYQYLAFKGAEDADYHTVLNRQKLRTLLEMPDLSSLRISPAGPSSSAAGPSSAAAGPSSAAAAAGPSSANAAGPSSAAAGPSSASPEASSASLSSSGRVTRSQTRSSAKSKGGAKRRRRLVFTVL